MSIHAERTRELENNDGSDALIESPSDVTLKRLQLCFATLCFLGGVVLSGSEDTQSLPYIAIFFALFGYVFVDWLQLFALPPLLAYFAMGCVAIYCVGNFWDLEAPGNTQMVSVAKLLVLVQSILMLQKKTPRIFEQLTVFCLLQLVVAAVFNHALSYGLLLVPISLLMATGLALLSSFTVDETAHVSGIGPLFRRPPSALASHVVVSGAESYEIAAKSASRLPRTVMVSVVPAVVLIGAMFFYALPRTTDASRPTSGGNALVGFSDHLNLDQIGEMQQNSQIALRVALRSPRDQPYTSRNGIYLRGRVMEIYDDDSDSASGDRRNGPRNGRINAIWIGGTDGSISSNQKLPPEFIPKQKSDRNFFDTVNVEITCELMGSPSLFAIAPYYRHGTSGDVVHEIQSWTLSRKEKVKRIYPRMRYRFLTHGFRDGAQTKILSRPTASDNPMLQPEKTQRQTPVLEELSDVEKRRQLYSGADQLLEFNAARIPTAVSLAESIVKRIPEGNRDPMRIARRIESFLSLSNEYSYTLNLNHERVPWMDPIEQFLSVDKKGHCQFFASAMVMMLRSQGIPARIVVGYRTDEYNELGQYYIARQLHAHAWVEAMIRADDLGPTSNVYGQSRTDTYWVRFDPTPSYSLTADEGGVSQVFDLAQNIWDDYVVDMDGGRQQNGMPGDSRDSTMLASYSSFFRWVEMRIAAIRAGQLGRGSLAIRPGFSWSAAILTITIGILVFLFSRIPLGRWFSKRRLVQGDQTHQIPKFVFYQQTLEQLKRLGIERETTQTPNEFAVAVGDVHQASGGASLRQPLDVLTTVYNRARYGRKGEHHSSEHDSGESTESGESLMIKGPEKLRVDTAMKQLTNRIDELIKREEPT
tara:strand:+ start:132892 stop:135504 length:2613 start_codon:yes stop_codon:yes gene_type:complete